MVKKTKKNEFAPCIKKYKKRFRNLGSFKSITKVEAKNKFKNKYFNLKEDMSSSDDSSVIIDS